MTTEEIEFFDRISTTWDDDEVLSTPDKIKEILSAIGVEAGMNILDLGTGTGVLVPYLSQAVGSNGHIDAVDVSEGMLKRAKQKYANLPNVAFIKMDFETEAIEGKYDLILLYCVYPHLHSPKETLKKLISDNLKENGRIIIAFPTDESFINNIHKERKAESDLLPSAPALSVTLSGWGIPSRVLKYDKGNYIIEVKLPQ